MKNIKYIALSLFLTVGLAGCEDFLTQPPYSQLVEEFFYENEEQVGLGVVGCYTQLQGMMRYEWAVTELRSDNTRAYGVNSTATASVELVNSDQNAFLTSNNNVNGYWEACYNEIYRCNNVLKYLDVVTTPELRNRYEGEMKFLRANAYFNLVRLWGASFLMTEPISVDEARYKQRTSASEVYALITSDLERIVDDALLPTRAEQPSAQIGHVVMEAAKVLLAKVYMTNFKPGSAEYAKADQLLHEVIVAMGDPQTGNDLVPYAEIFDVENEMNDEIIFTVRYKSGKIGLGSPFGNYFAPLNSGANVVNGNGSSWNYVTTNLIMAFNEEPADIRKDISLAESYVNKTNGTVITEEVTAGGARYIKKFLNEGMESGDGDSDWPLIRMGDVLLLYAETRNELQDLTTAVKYLNMIRQRAGLNDAAAGTSYDVRQQIRTERRKELAFENHRFFDLLRYGGAADFLNTFIATEGFYNDAKAFPYTPIKDWNLLLPIPQKVMNINPELAQNPGY